MPVAYKTPNMAWAQNVLKNGNNQSDRTAIDTAMLFRFMAEINLRSAKLPNNRRDGMLTIPKSFFCFLKLESAVYFKNFYSYL